MKRQNIDVKILVADVENWVDDKESSNKDEGMDMFLMAHTDILVANKEWKRSSTFDADLAKVVMDSKRHV